MIDNSRWWHESFANCNIGLLYGIAKTPEVIEGQTPHAAFGDVELYRLTAELTTQQIWDQFGDGDLSELLSYSINFPNDQRQFAIFVVWKVGVQFWCAYVRTTDEKRRLCIRHARADESWNNELCRLLRRRH